MGCSPIKVARELGSELPKHSLSISGKESSIQKYFAVKQTDLSALVITSWPRRQKWKIMSMQEIC